MVGYRSKNTEKLIGLFQHDTKPKCLRMRLETTQTNKNEIHEKIRNRINSVNVCCVVSVQLEQVK
jgi:hypothetical protein